MMLQQQRGSLSGVVVVVVVMMVELVLLEESRLLDFVDNEEGFADRGTEFRRVGHLATEGCPVLTRGVISASAYRR